MLALLTSLICPFLRFTPTSAAAFHAIEMMMAMMMAVVLVLVVVVITALAT
jgi:hypothetical protein